MLLRGPLKIPFSTVATQIGSARAHQRCPLVGGLCCRSLFAPLIANFSSCRRGFRVNMSHRQVINSLATSVTSLTPHLSAIVACSTSGGKFVTRRFQTFATQSALPRHSKIGDERLLSEEERWCSRHHRNDGVWTRRRHSYSRAYSRHEGSR